MTTTNTPPELPAQEPRAAAGGELPAGVEAQVRQAAKDGYINDLTKTLAAVPRPINWRTLPPDDLEQELLDLNAWVDWLRHTYGLQPQYVPPMWHRHPEMLWELSALRQHWLFCFDPQAKGNQALAWHHDFSIAKERLRDWVKTSGTSVKSDRPTPITKWPGGEAEDWVEPSTAEVKVEERTKDFLTFVEEQVAARVAEQDATIREIVNIEWSDRP